MTTAAFAVAELTEKATAVADVPILIIPGTTSKGPPAVPSALRPPVAVAPENATIEPIAMSARELGKAKANEAPSVPSATR